MGTKAGPVKHHLTLIFGGLILVAATVLIADAAGQELHLGNRLYRADSTEFQKPAAETKSPATDALSQLACCKPGAEPSGCDWGDPWTLMNVLSPCRESPITFGGWQQLGYTTQSTGLFNTNPDRINLHQSWLSAEKTCHTGQRNWDWGFRVDVMYGTDANDTQAFGNSPGTWDFQNGFDFGIYGWAIPQLYGQLAYKELSITIGHFYTIIGYEAVTAPSNFFFSHSYTMYNTEPFTHTGVLTSWKVDEKTTLYNGWTFGWDTGFDQLDHGSNYLGGVTTSICDWCSLTFLTSIGNFGARGRHAYTHSIVVDVEIPGKWNYVFQSDLLRVRSTGEYNVGVNQYLFYTLSDRVKLGSRVEWWKADAETDFTYGGQIAPPTATSSYCEATFGVNLRPHANLTFRPEFRHEWAPFANYQQSLFGIDMILSY